jgi:mannose-6-phosphate isomerase-like protein (cupin superfamily)
MEIVNLSSATPFRTKDGSEIRELLAHRNSSIRNQSLAEARLPSGAITTRHYHPVTEEIYYVLEGSGVMWIGEESAERRFGGRDCHPSRRAAPDSERR